MKHCAGSIQHCNGDPRRYNLKTLEGGFKSHTERVAVEEEEEEESEREKCLKRRRKTRSPAAISPPLTSTSKSKDRYPLPFNNCRIIFFVAHMIFLCFCACLDFFSLFC